jgi:hypothetical protein
VTVCFSQKKLRTEPCLYVVGKLIARREALTLATTDFRAAALKKMGAESMMILGTHSLEPSSASSPQQLVETTKWRGKVPGANLSIARKASGIVMLSKALSALWVRLSINFSANECS